ncbi:phage tail protein [Ulvibacter litoralis]|uniref:Microcystin-dependent protein n=1 Tax=Ulvibacter litoralis TaxID=227084 RepID=A0A1G7IVS1_9FLAO|nr:tail fiber protein [Ulvibacter litoralis]GHC63398.1 microcystin dependent MdpB family protein [Ulvibacter litoralis]SDF16664.1 Microcystin-dependent protein [Ulvibacter litoralis]
MESFIGQIMLFGGNFAPRDWAFCEGQLLAIASNQALFSILGTTYGGDGRTTFALPDLRGRVAIHEGTGPGQPTYRLGQSGGNTTRTLKYENLPQIPVKVSSANATQTAATAGASIATPGTTEGRTFTATEGFNTAAPDVQLNPATSGGNSTPINNMQPYLALSYIICLQGLFPSRN